MGGDMNLEEAKANIGKEVMLDEKDHNFKLLNESAIKEYGSSYKMVIKGCNHHHVSINIISCDGDISESLFARPEAIKLKEQPMQNYKIKVTPETSAEVQELFFELGCVWVDDRLGNKNTAKCTEKPYVYIDANKYITFSSEGSHLFFEGHTNQEITLPQLRDIVVLKRNDVSDTTHTDNVSKFYVGDSKVYQYHDNNWIECNILEANLKKIKKQELEMEWQDALRAVADGKDVIFKNLQTNKWDNIGELSVFDIIDADCEFRLKPKTIELNGEFTKEELLNILKEFE